MDIIEDLIIISRFFIIGLSIFGMLIWIIYYYKYKQPMAKAAIIWLANLVGFNIFRFVSVGNILENHHVTLHPEISKIVDTWSITLHLHAVVVLIAAYYIFRKKN